MRSEPTAKTGDSQKGDPPPQYRPTRKRSSPAGLTSISGGKLRRFRKNSVRWCPRNRRWYVNSARGRLVVGRTRLRCGSSCRRRRCPQPDAGQRASKRNAGHIAGSSGRHAGHRPPRPVVWPARDFEAVLFMRSVSLRLDRKQSTYLNRRHTTAPSPNVILVRLNPSRPASVKLICSLNMTEARPTEDETALDDERTAVSRVEPGVERSEVRSFRLRGMSRVFSVIPSGAPFTPSWRPAPRCFGRSAVTRVSEPHAAQAEHSRAPTTKSHRGRSGSLRGGKRAARARPGLKLRRGRVRRAVGACDR